MIPFAYNRAGDIRSAIAAASDANTYFIGGGTNLLDLMKAGVEKPTRLVDLNHLGLDKIESSKDGSIRIGAGARNSVDSSHEGGLVVLCTSRSPGPRSWTPECSPICSA